VPRRLVPALPVGRYENWAVCQALVPHAQAAADNPPKDETSLEAWASVLFKAAWYASEIGLYRKVYEMGSAVLQAREMILGAEHRDTLNSLNRVGTVWDRQGQYSKACAVHQRALEAKKRVLRYSHPETLTNIANLASTYRNRG
jgi:tetratricopeptide (TPR) repeat protein